jgi:hypothetical protein
MISTQEGPGNYRNNIPLPELLTAFTTHDIQAVRSDKLPAPLPDGFVRGNEGEWVDVTVKC